MIMCVTCFFILKMLIPTIQTFCRLFSTLFEIQSDAVCLISATLNLFHSEYPAWGVCLFFNLHLAQVGGGLTAAPCSHQDIMIQWRKIKGSQQVKTSNSRIYKRKGVTQPSAVSKMSMHSSGDLDKSQYQTVRLDFMRALQ